MRIPGPMTSVPSSFSVLMMFLTAIYPVSAHR
jgi:hypothetical protein